MSIVPLLLIVASAILHASWNTLAKKSHMTEAFYAIMSLASNFLWWHVLFWTPMPVRDFPIRFWMFLGMSVAADCCYCFGLVGAYRKLDMSTAYPVMRSLPILLTAAVTCIFGIGKMLSPMAVLGMFVVFVGCMVMPLAKFSDFSISNYMNRNMLYLFIAAGGTTGYTILDKLAQNQILPVAEELAISKPVLSMTFYVLRGITLCSVLTVYALCVRKEREVWLGFFRAGKLTPILAGIFASSTYVLVLIAMNYVDNVSYVQVFRQMGLIFGLLAGIFVLREKCTITKVTGVVFILAGLVMTVL